MDYPDKNRIIAMGASTGGTEALLSVLRTLPANMPGIVIVQHMPPGFTKLYADRLNGLCKLEVKEAKSGDAIRSGLALIAPGDSHMRIKKMGNLCKAECFHGQKVNGHIPSVDVLFNSVAECYGEDAIGVILTGMGKDGAKGLLNMRRRGARTIGQDQSTSIVYGMPMVAYEMGAVEKQSPLEHISGILTSLL